MKHLELFSGIGGFRLGVDLALQDNSLDSFCVGFSEINPDSIKVYKHFFDNSSSMELGDIVNLCKDESTINALPNFDLLTAGFPCQPFSIMGKQLGFDDSRGTMFYYILKILSIKRPRYILLENVKNLFTHDKGKTYKKVYNELSNLGYKIQADIFNTAKFGLAQTRNRVYILGVLNEDIIPSDFANEVEKHFKKISLNHNILIQKSVIDVLDLKVDKKYYLSERIKPTILSDGTGGFKSQSIINKEIARPLTASMHKMHRACQDNYFSSTFIESRGLFHDEQNKTKEEIAELDIRRLTPKEAFLLQGFPMIFVNRALAIGISDGALYKQAGNAVSVNVVYAIIHYLLSKINVENGIY